MDDTIALIVTGFAGIVVLAVLSRRLLLRSNFPNLPAPPAGSLLTGNVHRMRSRHSIEYRRHVTDTHGPLFKLAGPYGAEWLYIYDPKALYSIAIKDQDVWGKHGALLTMIMLGPGLLATEHHQHRKQRKMLTPVFSAAYLRNITSVFYETTYKLRDAVLADINSDADEIDVLKWTGRAALELLGQGALGHSFDPLTKEVPDAFAAAVKSFFAALGPLHLFHIMLGPLRRCGPSWFRRMVVDAAPFESVQRMKAIVDTMHARSIEIVEEKRASLMRDDEAMQRLGEGKDVMSILLRANMAAGEKDRLTEEELIAQVSTFVLAGMDTTSIATSRVLHILASKKDAQTKLRNEILEAQAGTEVSYDTLMELPFLDAVCRETLRVYAPVTTISRYAVKDTVLGLSAPIRHRRALRPRRVQHEHGACNTNTALWGPDAREWKPERWLAPLPREVEEVRVPGVYSNLMTFHGGGRSCIGFKYAQLELKVVLAVLLANFRFELSDKDIVWNSAGVMYPTVGPVSKKPEMPLKVSVFRERM
ncbi:cytochrome P450 [Epithele typhae]|uniref:cytochrome P450 n=1 Tax=Epithele typhae TaxID=378194 RepID=UPI0020085C88|nr:cytochrome P450 [Epithele typhae]KAH9923757.1 cytochrome P450 [Epithele typhae]